MPDFFYNDAKLTGFKESYKGKHEGILASNEGYLHQIVDTSVAIIQSVYDYYWKKNHNFAEAVQIVDLLIGINKRNEAPEGLSKELHGVRKALSTRFPGDALTAPQAELTLHQEGNQLALDVAKLHTLSAAKSVGSLDELNLASVGGELKGAAKKQQLIKEIHDFFGLILQQIKAQDLEVLRSTYLSDAVSVASSSLSRASVGSTDDDASRSMSRASWVSTSSISQASEGASSLSRSSSRLSIGSASQNSSNSSDDAADKKLSRISSESEIEVSKTSKPVTLKAAAVVVVSATDSPVNNVAYSDPVPSLSQRFKDKWDRFKHLFDHSTPTQVNTHATAPTSKPAPRVTH